MSKRLDQFLSNWSNWQANCEKDWRSYNYAREGRPAKSGAAELEIVMKKTRASGTVARRSACFGLGRNRRPTNCEHVTAGQHPKTRTHRRGSATGAQNTTLNDFTGGKSYSDCRKNLVNQQSAQFAFASETDQQAARCSATSYFDWSGTLCNDLPPVIETINRILNHCGADEVDEATFRADFRLPFGSFYEKRLPGEKHDRLEALYDEFFPLSQRTAEPIPHALEFVNAVRQEGRRLFVLSAVTASHFAEQTELLGFCDSFERTYLEIRDKREVIGQLLEENGLAPEETCFIGDMEHDVATAKHAGITSIAVLTGYDSLEKLAPSET